MKKSSLITGLIIAVLLAVIIWFFWPRDAGQGQQGMGGAGGYGAQGPVPAETLKVTQKSIDLTMELPARVVAFRQSEVRPQVSGIIEKRLFEQGSMVKKGQQLYQLDDARYSANLKSAEADLQNTRAQQNTVKARANRIQSLEAKQAVSEQDLDDVLAQLEQAKAAIAVAQANVDLQQINIEYAEIKAPISGRIGQSFLTEGALVSTGQQQPLAIITQLNPLYVDMQVSADRAQHVMKKLSELQARQSNQTDSASTNPKAQLTVTVEQAGNAAPLQGKLEFSDVVVDESSGAITLRALVDNSKGTLLPGMFVTATIQLGVADAILVPQRAASRNPQGGLDVWLVNADNTAKKVTVNSNETYQDQWIINEGINANQTIVVAGYQKLKPGSQVTVSQSASAGGQRQPQNKPPQSAQKSMDKSDEQADEQANRE